MLNTNPEIQQRMRERFSNILVDEYQDSNIAQFELLKSLTGHTTKLCVVGDDDQSIYKFRGAEVNNILEFPNAFPPTTIIKLETNYRSYQSILDVAHAVVSNNINRMGKKLVAIRTGGEQPQLKALNSDIDEATYCAKIIDKEVRAGKRYSDFAILYRTNAQSRIFEQVFTQQFIPFIVVGALRFFEREEVKDALAYASLIQNPHDIVACKRIINKPARGIGAVTFSKLLTYSAEHAVSIIEACKNYTVTSKKTMQGLEQFVHIINELHHTLAAAENLGDFFKKLISLSPDEIKRLNNEKKNDILKSKYQYQEYIVKDLTIFIKNLKIKQDLYKINHNIEIYRELTNNIKLLDNILDIFNTSQNIIKNYIK